MKLLIDSLAKQVGDAFEALGYDRKLGRVTLSNRPDLCEYQCNGALAGAKLYHKAPVAIAGQVAEQLRSCDMFSSVEAVSPGFLNLSLSEAFLADYVAGMAEADKLGCEPEATPKNIIVDYGGPNVAKPLHIGHLRSAIIGESIKRIYRFFGNRVIGDIHLGDWGLQMGLIIAELQERKPDLPYFDRSYTGEYPEEAPFTISELEEIYPKASAKSKEDAEFARKAHDATYALQKKERGLYTLWQHIIRISVADLRQNYAKLNVSFDVWLGESDAQAYIPEMLDIVRGKGLAVESDGALVVPVQEEHDSREIPPCILLKSDGASLYATTDLATIVQRVKDFQPDKMTYLTDKRQNLHFEQVFRVAKKAGLVKEETELVHIGFGTMNGRDGKPFKTRSGGVMRLETLISEITDYVTEKMQENQNVPEAESEKTAAQIAISALKYGDLSNLAAKDYVFDLDRFSSFEGNTGPYILYTIVRIKSILAKCPQDTARKLLPADSREQKELMLVLARMQDALRTAYRDSTPNTICAYCYELATAANKFYHDVKILTETDSAKQGSYLALIALTRRALELCIDLLGFEAPERM